MQKLNPLKQYFAINKLCKSFTSGHIPKELLTSMAMAVKPERKKKATQ